MAGPAAIHPSEIGPSSKIEEDQDEDYDLKAPVKKIRETDRQINRPTTPPAAKEELKREREGEVKKIESVGQKRPDNPKAQREVTKALVGVGENDRAMPFADRGVELAEKTRDPKALGDSLALRAQVQQKRGRVEEAYADSARACELDPANTKACQISMMTRGRTNRGVPASPRAVQEGFKEPSPSPGPDPWPTGGPIPSVAPQGAGANPGPGASGTDPTRSLALVNEGLARMKLDPQAGLRLLDRAVAADPASAKARVARSQGRRIAGDGPGALKDAEAAVRLDPRNAAAFAARGQAKAALGRPPEEVTIDLATARELDPGFSALYTETLARLGLGNSGLKATSTNETDQPEKHSSRQTKGSLMGRLRSGNTALTIAAALILLFGIAFVIWKKQSGSPDPP